ncbi:MAG TPA: SRPBCC family protein [Sphingobium sp.]|nr:SRPBCC family protein [Sphingobium sp.]
MSAAPAKMFSKHLHEKQAQTYAELLDRDSRPVPDHVRNFAGDGQLNGPTLVPTRWYTDPELHKLEIEHLWKRKWQMACRAEHVCNVGDTFVYNVATLSFVIVRVSEDVVKGYWNSCLHRGVPLRQCAGRVDRLQCPFHGFTWNLNGENVLIPHPEEFPDIDQKNFNLPEVLVSEWNGFIFINPDLEAESLESYLGPIDTYFAPYGLKDRELTAHVVKEFPANWKTLQESFLESFHVLTTHPQFAISNAGDRCSEFGYDGNVARGIVPMGTTSDYVAHTPDESQIFPVMNEFWDDEDGPTNLPEGMSARQAYAQACRNAFVPIYGDKIESVSDAEMIDVFYFSVFPNFLPYSGYAAPLIYRFLPHGNDPEKSLMEIMFITPVVPGSEPKPLPKPIWLKEDQEFTEVKELGSFASFISQDCDNLNGIMTGLRNNKTGVVHFARKFESLIRRFYKLYEDALGLSAEAEIAALNR